MVAGWGTGAKVAMRQAILFAGSVSLLMSLGGLVDAKTVQECIDDKDACKKRCDIATSPILRSICTDGCYRDLDICYRNASDKPAAVQSRPVNERGPASKPPPRVKPGVIAPGLLDNSPGFSSQGPSAVGSPAAPAKPPPSFR